MMTNDEIGKKQAAGTPARPSMYRAAEAHRQFETLVDARTESWILIDEQKLLIR
jgi:hypothetical protein